MCREMDKATKKFNELMEEIKSMFVVSQAMAKNSFNSTIESMKNEGAEHTKTIDINQIHQLGLMLTATTENDIERLVAIVNCLKTFV